MAFEVLDSLSLPGDPAKPNEDAFAAEPFAAVVFDGATMDKLIYAVLKGMQVDLSKVTVI